MKWYTTAEVAKILICSNYHVMCLVRTKRLKGLKIGKAWRFTEKAIEDLNKISDEVSFRPTVLVPQRKRGRKTQ